MYVCVCVCVGIYVHMHVCLSEFIYSFIFCGSLHHSVSISAYAASNDRTISKRQIGKWKVYESDHCLN